MLIRCWLPPESVGDLVVAAVGEPGLLEHRLDRRLDVVDALEPGEQAQVLGDGQPPVERGLLRDPADLAAGGLDLAGVGLGDPGEDRRAASSCRRRSGRRPRAARPRLTSKLTSRSAVRSP